MEKKYTYDYPKLSLTTDAVVFGYDFINNDLKVLLIQRANQPFKDRWALPGGFVDMNETVEESVKRELKEETNLEDIFLEQLQTFSQLGRDPRGRTVSVVFYGLINMNKYTPKPGDDAQNVEWFSIKKTPFLAFDHGEIISKAIIQLHNKIKYEHIDFLFIPKAFSLLQLENIKKSLIFKKLNGNKRRITIFNK